MSTSVTIVQQQPIAPRPQQSLDTPPQKRPLQVRGKLKTSLDLMVWGTDEHLALAWDAAARSAGMSVRAMRKALEKPHVRRYLREQRHVFLESASAKNPQRLVQLRDQDDNRTAAVSAIKQIEDMAEERSTSAGQRVTQPGVTIYIGTERTARDADKAMIEINPLSEHDNTEHGA